MFVVMLLTAQDVNISKDKCPIRNRENILRLRHLLLNSSYMSENFIQNIGANKSF